MKVLVVEEQRMFAEALSTSLAAEDDIEIVGTVQTIADALDVTTQREPDVVTTAYRLPDGDGIELITRINHHPGSAKVVLVTSFEQKEVLAAAIDAGCSGFVPKSAPVSDVAVAVRAAMTGQVAIPPKLLARVLKDAGLERWHGTQLTPIELEILQLFPDGPTDRKIAQTLGLSESSVRNHVGSILSKLESHSKLQGLATAIRRGIILLTISGVGTS